MKESRHCKKVGCSERAPAPCNTTHKAERTVAQGLKHLLLSLTPSSLCPHIATCCTCWLLLLQPFRSGPVHLMSEIAVVAMLPEYCPTSPRSPCGGIRPDLLQQSLSIGILLKVLPHRLKNLVEGSSQGVLEIFGMERS